MASSPGGHPFGVYADFTTGSGYGASFREMLGYFEDEQTFVPDPPPPGFWDNVTDEFPGVDEEDVEEALYHLFAEVIDADMEGTPLEGMVANEASPSAADVLYLQQIGVPDEAVARHILTDPGSYARESGTTIGDEALTEFLDRRMGTDGANTWTNGSFDAAGNAIRFAQLSLLESRELNYFLCLHNVGPLYPADGGLKDCIPEPTFLTCPIVVTPGSSGSLSEGTVESSECPEWEPYDPNENLPPFLFADGLDPEAGTRIVPNIWIAAQGSGARADLASHHQVGQELLVATSVSYRPGQGPMLLNLTDPDGVVFGEWSRPVTIPGSEVVVLPTLTTSALDQAGEWTLMATFANGTAVHKFAVHDPYEHPVPVPRSFALDFIGQTDRGSAWRMVSNEGSAHGVWADCPARGRAWTDTFAISRPTTDSALPLGDRAVPMSQTPPPKAWAQLSNGTGLMKFDRFVVGPESVLNLSVHWKEERYWGENDYELTYAKILDDGGPTADSLRPAPSPGDRTLTFDAPGNYTVKFHAGGICSDFRGDSRTVGNEHVLEFHADPALGPYPGETTICPSLICGSVAFDPNDIELAILAGERLRGLFGVVEPFIPEKPRDGGLPPGPDPAPWLDELPIGIRAVVENEIQKPAIQEAFAFGGRSLTRLGVTLDQAGRPEAADVSYRLAGFVGKTDPRTQVSLSHAHIQRGDLSQADVYADRALLLAENEAAPHVTKGSVQLAREDGRQAETSFRIAMTRDPTRPDAMVGMGKALQVQDRPREAVEFYSAALSSLSEGSESYSVVEALRDQAAAEDLETTPAPGAPFVFALVAAVFLWRRLPSRRDID